MAHPSKGGVAKLKAYLSAKQRLPVHQIRGRRG